MISVFTNTSKASSFTTAQLKALDPAASAALRVAYCSDCYNTGAFDYGMTGALVFWSGTTTSGSWLTLSDNVPICSTADADGFTEWCMWLHARNRGEIKTAIATILSMPLSNNQGLRGSWLSGSSGISAYPQAPINSDHQGGYFELLTGTTSGSFGLRYQYSDTTNIFNPSTGIRRKVGIVASMGVSETATNANNAFALSVGLERSSTDAIQTVSPFTGAGSTSEFAGFVYDPQNAHGFGTALDANWNAMLRRGGTTIGTASTSIPISTRTQLAVALEPNGNNTARTTAIQQGVTGAGTRCILEASGAWTNTAVIPTLNLFIPSRTATIASRTIRLSRVTVINWYESGTRIVPVAPITSFTNSGSIIPTP